MKPRRNEETVMRPAALRASEQKLLEKIDIFTANGLCFRIFKHQSFRILSVTVLRVSRIHVTQSAISVMNRIPDYFESCINSHISCFSSGIDHGSTMFAYINLAVYCFANSQILSSLRLLYRAKYLMSMIYGEDHPDMAQINVSFEEIYLQASYFVYSIYFEDFHFCVS